MTTATRRAILKALGKYNEKHGYTTYSIKKDKPYPVSPRWIDNLIAAERDSLETTFNKEKTKELCDFLKLPFRVDGGIIIITKRQIQDDEKETTNTETNN